jgi:hypothetical protein
MLGFSSVVSAQPSPNPNTKRQDDGVPAMLRESTIKTIIDLVSRSVARRYDLRPDQADAAKQMLEKNTMEFVNKHYNDLMVIVPQMQDMRMKVMAGQEPDASQVKLLAKKMAPIYKEATDLIVSENNKFHETLDDQQKVKHQRDMDQMKQDVSQTTEKLNRWKEGGYKPGEFLGKRGQTNKQRRAQKDDLAQELTSQTSFKFWEEYVKMFIEAFQLDAGQIPMAYAVLNDVKKEATAYRQDHSREFAELKENLAKLTRTSSTQPDQDKELKKWKDKEQKLEKPLLNMFDELKSRLMAIPTDEQRKAAQETLTPEAGKSEKSEKSAAGEAKEEKK